MSSAEKWKTFLLYSYMLQVVGSLSEISICFLFIVEPLKRTEPRHTLRRLKICRGSVRLRSSFKLMLNRLFA